MSVFRAIAMLRAGNLCKLTLSVFCALTVMSSLATRSQAAVVESDQKISATEGGFTGVLDDDDRLSAQIASIGDFDGDGVVDIAVGAPTDDDGGTDRGAVWLMFLNSNGTVKAHAKISSTEGNFPGPLNDGDKFSRVASLGDLDGDEPDHVIDLAVGAHTDDDGGPDRGAVWILFLNDDGTVHHHQKISDTEGGFTGVLGTGDHFGWSTAELPDMDGDGNPELAVGANGDDDGAINAGAVWILFLDSDGTVKSYQKISATEGGFNGELDVNDGFGHSVASLGDLDNDGVQDLAVGASGDDDGGTNRGAVWNLFLNANGTVKAHQKISSTEGNFATELDDNDLFGRVVSLPDLNYDGVPDLAVGAVGDENGGVVRGAMWILFLKSDGTVQARKKIRNRKPAFEGENDYFGFSGAWLGDLDGDGHGDLAVGALFDDDGGPDRGAVWICFLGEVASAAPETGSPRVMSFAVSPNPFRSQSTFEYALANATAVQLSIFDAQGRRVATLVDRQQSVGIHAAVWSGRDDTGFPVSAGVYLARLEAAGRTAVRKIVVVR